MLAGNTAASTPNGIKIIHGREYTWPWNRNDPRILEEARSASCWFAEDGVVVFYSPENDIPYQLTIHCLDYDRAGRSFRVTVTDGLGKVFDIRQLSAEETKEGVYCTWKASGQIQVLVEPDQGTPNATVSGVFIDPVMP